MFVCTTSEAKEKKKKLPKGITLEIAKRLKARRCLLHMKIKTIFVKH